MLFNSTDFLIFFLIVYAVYVGVRSYKAQNFILLAASYFFYAYWKVEFLLLILFTTAFNYAIGSVLFRLADDRRRKAVVALAVTVNLSVLGIFKYYNFGVENFVSVLNAVGLQANIGTLKVILPVGISFYTFQCIGYVVDVYRRHISPPKDLLAFSLYVAFFPQLVAGPIERAQRLIPQFARPRFISRRDLLIGVMWIAEGYFLKVVIADTLGPFVDYVFDHPGAYYASGVTSFIGVLAFGLQIFGDFAGYSLIARGLARIMGIRLMANFAGPMLALNPAEFWRRWHISLSTWLRDYLYIPLGGNRKGEGRTYVNMMITMLLGGLWHGAAWNFIMWGGYQGGLLAVHRWLDSTYWWRRAARWIRPLRLPGMFVLMSFGWFLFRVDSYAQFKALSVNILDNFYWESQSADALMVYGSALVITLAYHVWEEGRGEWSWIIRARWAVRMGLVSFLVLSIVGVGFQQSPFIYFQF